MNQQPNKTTETAVIHTFEKCNVCNKMSNASTEYEHPRIERFLVCYKCNHHGYMIPGQGWNVGE